MDQEYNLNVGASTFKADLLFFHRGLQALIAPINKHLRCFASSFLPSTAANYFSQQADRLTSSIDSKYYLSIADHSPPPSEKTNQPAAKDGSKSYMCYAINASVCSYIHTSASSRHINCPCFAYTNARNRAKKRQGMKKDYRTSTNHEQWPRLASTHLIILT